MVMINKNPVALACPNTKNLLQDVWNNQSQDLEFPLE